MVVCHCLAVNHEHIADLAADPAVGVDDITARCGAGGVCGGCRPTIQALLDRSRAATTHDIRLAVAR